MWSPRRRLKTSTQTHRKLDVRPRRRQVQEGADHAPVLLLVHGLFVLVCVERCSRTHLCRQGLWVIHFELLEYVLRVLGWCTKVSSFACLIWSPRKNCNYPIIDITNSLLISSANLGTKEWDEPPKTILMDRYGEPERRGVYGSREKFYSKTRPINPISLVHLHKLLLPSPRSHWSATRPRSKTQPTSTRHT
jgi:hypothetical protein